MTKKFDIGIMKGLYEKADSEILESYTKLMNAIDFIQMANEHNTPEQHKKVNDYNYRESHETRMLVRIIDELMVLTRSISFMRNQYKM